jgi:hypothetical protein
MACSSDSKMADPRFKPINNICMALNAFHIYTDEARKGVTRPIMSHHYCSHIREGMLELNDHSWHLTFLRSSPVCGL